MTRVQTTSLKNKKIVITRPLALAANFSKKISELKAIPFEFPTIEIIPSENTTELDQAIFQLKRFDIVIFTSVNGVNYFINRLKDLNLNPESNFGDTKIAAIGPATVKELKKYGIYTDFMPSNYIAESIADEIGEVKDKNILLPKADIARVELNDLLENKGANVTEISTYKTIIRKPSEIEVKALIDFKPDIVTFTSSSTVRGFFNAIKNTNFEVKNCVIACIGPVTAKTAVEFFGKADIVGEPYTVDGLVNALLDTDFTE